jgi:heme/copper-type cytochrome/quinol oxidase subunit 3
VVADVSHLPPYGHGRVSTMWWGTLGFVTIEAMGFALAFAVYIYLAYFAEQWPLSAAPPDLWPGSLSLIVILASLWPNRIAEKAAAAENLPRVRVSMVLMCLVGVAAIVIRGFEFGVLNIRWDANAYGSILWVLIGLHTLHLITDVGDTLVLTVLMFTRHGKGRRFSDVADNAFYWYFVVASWVPVYFFIYWAARL